MPLLKRKPYALEAPPQDLKAEEPVFQVRPTKEIFRSYDDYLKRMQLYRKRIWTCKVTGKQSLTYEEALVSEKKATEEVQLFPKEFMGPVLSLVQFSPLRTDDLVDKICKSFKDRYVLNEEVFAKSSDLFYPCKILKVVQHATRKDDHYEVGWLDKNGKKTRTSMEASTNLMRKKLPFTKALLKAFIREAAVCGTARNSVWIVYSKLARKYKIPADHSSKMSGIEGKNSGQATPVPATDIEITANGGQYSRKRRKPEDDSPASKRKPMKKHAIETPQVQEAKPAKKAKCVPEKPISVDDKPTQRARASTKRASTVDEKPSPVKRASTLEGKPTVKKASARIERSSAAKKALSTEKSSSAKKATAVDDKTTVGRKARTTEKSSVAKKTDKQSKGKQGSAGSGDIKSVAKSAVNTNDKSARPTKKAVKKEAAPAPAPAPGPAPAPAPPPPPPIKYPIEDTLVGPCPDDPVFTARPIPSTDFALPMDCVGSALMVWDFCTTFGKALHLSPFSLEELEKSLDYREGNAPLVAEVVFALLRTSLGDPNLFDEFVKKRKRKSEISINTWKDDLSDLLQLTSFDKLGPYLLSIRQGSYRQFDTSLKLEILQDLVNRCLNSSVIRNQIDENIGENQALFAKKREEDSECVKRRKQEKQKQLPNQPAAAVGPETNGKAIREGDPPDEAASNSADETENASVGKNEVKDEAACGEDGQAIGWKTKGKRKLGGGNSPVSTNGPGKKDDHSDVNTGSKSRQAYLRQKEALRQADEKRLEEKLVQEKKKGQIDAAEDRLTPEQIILENQKRQDHLDRELEKRSIRTCQLGKDRDRNSYWFFPREGRLFVEDESCSRWCYYSAKEEFDDLLHSLNPKGIRERCLQTELEKHTAKICNVLARRSKEIAQKMALEEVAVRRSVRVRSAPRLPAFLSYVNKLRPN